MTSSWSGDGAVHAGRRSGRSGGSSGVYSQHPATACATGHGGLLQAQAAQPSMSRGAVRRQHRHRARKQEVQEGIDGIRQDIGSDIEMLRSELGGIRGEVATISELRNDMSDMKELLRQQQQLMLQLCWSGARADGEIGYSCANPDALIVKQIEAPLVQTIENPVEIPQAQTVEKVLGIPQVHTFSEAIPCDAKSSSRHSLLVPAVGPVEHVVVAPSTQTFEKTVEIPQAQAVVKIVDFPQMQTFSDATPSDAKCSYRHSLLAPAVGPVEPVVEVPIVKYADAPSIQTIEKTVEIPQAQTVVKVVDLPQVQIISDVIPSDAKSSSRHSLLAPAVGPVEHVVKVPIAMHGAPSTQTIEKADEIPQAQTVEKIVVFPQMQTATKQALLVRVELYLEDLDELMNTSEGQQRLDEVAACVTRGLDLLAGAEAPDDVLDHEQLLKLDINCLEEILKLADQSCAASASNLEPTPIHREVPTGSRAHVGSNTRVPDGTNTRCTDCNHAFVFYHDEDLACPCGGLVCHTCLERHGRCRNCKGKGDDVRYKTRPCCYYDAGGCPCGRQCHFAHGPQDLRPTRKHARDLRKEVRDSANHMKFALARPTHISPEISDWSGSDGEFDGDGDGDYGEFHDPADDFGGW